MNGPGFSSGEADLRAVLDEMDEPTFMRECIRLVEQFTVPLESIQQFWSEGRKGKKLNGKGPREPERRTPRLLQLDPENIGQREYLWKPYIPRGRFVGVEGAGDVGKTFVWCDLVSRIVRGDVMPDGSSGVEGCVLWVTDEEGGEEEARRLLAAGLNPNLGHFDRIATLATDLRGRAIELPRDMDLIRDAAAELQQRTGVPLQAIFLDPLFQFLEGNVDENKAKDVRKAVAPLNPLARELNCTILGLRHWNKSSKQARRDRGAGSAQFSSTFRVQLSIFRHPQDRDVRVLANDMNRYAAESDRPPLGFRLVEDGFGRQTARVDWVGPLELPEEGVEPTPLVGQVEAYLRQTVNREGEEYGIPSKELLEAAQKATGRHFSVETFRQAAKAAGLLNHKRGLVWSWFKPSA